MKLLVILIGLCSICLSCRQKADVSNAQYIKDLVETHKLILPVDENTYYMSKSMFQFEEDNKEYLYFLGKSRKESYLQNNLTRYILKERKGPISIWSSPHLG